MIYLINKSTDPSFNHGLEEFLLKERDESYFLLWQNEPSILIGKNQNPLLEINLDYLKENNIKLIRRLSGGGAIYTDLLNMQYTFISKLDRKEENLFSSFARPLIYGLNSMGLEASFTGRNDILINGLKVSGNAQYRYKDRILHHGSLIFDMDKEILSKSLIARDIKFIDKSVKSHKSRIGRIKDMVSLDLKNFMKELEKSIIDFYKIEEVRSLSEEEIQSARKYEVNFPDLRYSRDLTSAPAIFSKKYPFGLLEFSIKFDSSKIQDLKINGDFFEEKDLKDYISLAKGMDIEELDRLDIGNYILGLDNEEFVKEVRKIYDKNKDSR